MNFKQLRYKVLTSLRHPGAFARAMRFKKLHAKGTGELVKIRLKEMDTPMYISTADPGISRDLMVWREREVEATKTLMEHLKPGQTILELGANIGYYALLESKKIGPTGRIYALEPAPDNLALLQKNIELNGVGEYVTAEHGAVGDETKTATLHLVDKSNLHCINEDAELKPDLNFVGKVDVPMFRVDDYLEQRGIDPKSVDVLRMDIEGFEVEAFAGMPNLFNQDGELLIFVEIHPELIKHRLGDQAYVDFINSIADANFEILGAARSRTSRIDIALDITSVRDLAKEDWAIEVILKRSA